MIVEDQQADGTSGGTFTSGARQTRTLNTVVLNTITGASLLTNQVVLPPGTYEIEWSAPAYRVEDHTTYLRNVTDSVDVARGSRRSDPAVAGGVDAMNDSEVSAALAHNRKGAALCGWKP